MAYDYCTVVTTISSLAIFANFLLLFLSLRSKALNDDHSRYMILMKPVMDLVYAVCYLLVAPIPHSRDFTFVWPSTGPAAFWWPDGMIFVTFLCSTTIGSLLLVGSNFVYRYITLCKSNLAYIFTMKKYLAIGILINLICTLNWLGLIFFALWPNDKLKYAAEFVYYGDLNLTNRVYLGFTSLGGADPVKLAIMIESLALMLSLAQLSPFCAYRIHKCLKSSSLSDRTKEIYRELLIVLSIQIACPTILMHLPLGMMFIMLFTGLPSPDIVNNFVGIAMALNPLSGPLVSVLCVKDYRNILLTTLKIQKQRSSAIPIASATFPR
uniref:G protein-coupled receptor n=1 Tax=Haemonchus contortus TaxID=6289 RepID=A0A7I4Z054_HAECO